MTLKESKAEYVQRRVCFVNVQSSLHENVVFSVCARMCNAAYVIFVMWNSMPQNPVNPDRADVPAPVRGTLP